MSAVLAHKGANADQPNVILITLDDAGMQLSSYGDHTIETPNLDRIASDGVRFTQGYVAYSSCSSSRSAMFTGLYPHQNGQIGLTSAGFSMSEAFPTIPSILRNAGYRTGVIGKVHVQPKQAFSWTYQSPYLKWQWGTRDVVQVASEASKFFTASSQPFFLKVSYLDPHLPRTDQILGIPPTDQLVHASDIRVNTWTGKTVTSTASEEDIATYYNCIKRIDIGVGMLLDALAAAGKADNTLIILLGDNGGGAVQLGKADIYESGLRVPFIVRYPREGRPGQVRDELVSAVDILPTILDAAGVAVPEPTKSMMTEGSSLMPIIRGEAVPGWRRYLFAEMEYHNTSLFKPSRAVRDERYKLIRSYPPLNRGVGNLMLFDLANDRLEKTNLVANPSYSDVRDRLLDELSAWQARSDDFRN
ncbi:MAG: sulfatase [Rhodospirillales bacterium]